MSPPKEASPHGVMEQILKQQEELLKFGEELLKESSKKMREAAGPDAWAQAYDVWMVRAVPKSFYSLRLTASDLCLASWNARANVE